MAQQLRNSAGNQSRKRAQQTILHRYGITVPGVGNQGSKRAKKAPDQNGESNDSLLARTLRASTLDATRRRIERQSLKKRLQQNMEAVNMVLRRDVPGDGNCFYHCINDQMDRLGITHGDEAKPTVATLREDVASFLSDLDEDDPLKTHVSNELLDDIKRDGVWADHVVIQAMARLLKRDIWLVTSNRARTDMGNLLEKLPSGYEGAPMLLGHLDQFHFWSLETKNDNTGPSYSSVLTSAAATSSTPSHVTSPSSPSNNVASGVLTYAQAVVSTLANTTVTSTSEEQEGVMISDNNHDDTVSEQTENMDTREPCKNQNEDNVRQESTNCVTPLPNTKSRRQSSIEKFFRSRPNQPSSRNTTDIADGQPRPNIEEHIEEHSEDSQASVQSCQEATDDLTVRKFDVANWIRKTCSREEKYEVLNNVFTPGPDYKFPVKTYTSSTTGKTKRRSFQHKWLQRFPGLAYSPSEDGAFCLHCVLFTKDLNAHGVLVKKPFDNWKDAVVTFEGHFNDNRKDHTKGARGYEAHKNCTTEAIELKRVLNNEQIPVDDLINTTAKERIRNNTKALESIADTILTCGRQGLALRGHRDDSQHIDDDSNNPGNFIEFLKFRVRSGDDNLKEHFKSCNRNATYRSKTTQNELINIIGDQIKRTIVERCKHQAGRGYFSVIADELQDRSNKEQLSLSIRYVTGEGDDIKVREDCLGFADVTGHITGEELASTIIKFLQDADLDIGLLRGQCYDGAGNMAGSRKGAGPRIERDWPKAPFFWCAAHQLNRTLVKPCQITIVRNMMGTADRVVKFFNFSSKKNYKLAQMIKADEERRDASSGQRKRTKLKDICQTRWVDRHDAYEVFIDLFPEIVNTLTAISTDDTGDTSDATTLLAAVTKFEFIAALTIASHLMGYLKGASGKLQGRQVDIIHGFGHVTLTQAKLEKIRSEELTEKHAKMYTDACSLAASVSVEPAKPRTCSVQTRRDNPDIDDSEPDKISAYYRIVLTIPLLDHLLAEFSSRFNVLKEKAVNGFAILPVLAAKTLPPVSSFEFFESDIPYPRSFEQELELWQMHWSSVTEEERPNTALRALMECDQAQFPNIYTILHILVVFPVTSAEAERSFSGLTRLKSRLRSTMTEHRLNGLALMNIHREEDVNITNVVRTFAAAHPRKMRLAFVLDDPRDS